MRAMDDEPLPSGGELAELFRAAEAARRMLMEHPAADGPGRRAARRLGEALAACGARWPVAGGRES